MQPNPLVSILIDNYNYGRFLGEAIESALGQGYSNLEVIVVDDGSTDNSHEVMQSFGTRIISVHKPNGGQASSFNAGLAASQGAVICFLDADDLFERGKVERVVEVLTEHADLGWCWDVERKFQDESKELLPRHPLGITGRWDAREQMLAGKPPRMQTACSGLSFRRETLAKIFPIPEVFLFADGYVKLTALALMPGWLEPEQLTLQRIHQNNFYTNQPAKKRHAAGRTGLLIGLTLAEHFLPLKKAAIHMATRGLGRCWATGGVDPDCKGKLKPFLASLSPPSRIAFLAKSAYWSARSMVSREV